MDRLQELTESLRITSLSQSTITSISRSTVTSITIWQPMEMAVSE